MAVYVRRKASGEVTSVTYTGSASKKAAEKAAKKYGYTGAVVKKDTSSSRSRSSSSSSSGSVSPSVSSNDKIDVVFRDKHGTQTFYNLTQSEWEKIKAKEGYTEVATVKSGSASKSELNAIKSADVRKIRLQGGGTMYASYAATKGLSDQEVVNQEMRKRAAKSSVSISKVKSGEKSLWVTPEGRVVASSGTSAPSGLRKEVAEKRGFKRVSPSDVVAGAETVQTTIRKREDGTWAREYTDKNTQQSISAEEAESRKRSIYVTIPQENNINTSNVNNGGLQTGLDETSQKNMEDSSMDNSGVARSSGSSVRSVPGDSYDVSPITSGLKLDSSELSGDDSFGLDSVLLSSVPVSTGQETVSSPIITPDLWENIQKAQLAQDLAQKKVLSQFGETGALIRSPTAEEQEEFEFYEQHPLASEAKAEASKVSWESVKSAGGDAVQSFREDPVGTIHSMAMWRIQAAVNAATAFGKSIYPEKYGGRKEEYQIDVLKNVGMFALGGTGAAKVGKSSKLTKTRGATVTKPEALVEEASILDTAAAQIEAIQKNAFNPLESSVRRGSTSTTAYTQKGFSTANGARARETFLAESDAAGNIVPVKHTEVVNIAYRERVGASGDINTLLQTQNKVKVIRQGKYRGDTKVYLDKKGNVEIYVETKPNQYNPDLVNYRVLAKEPTGKTKVIEKGTADADAYYFSLREATYGKGTYPREYSQYMDEGLNRGVGEVKLKGTIEKKPVEVVNLTSRKIKIVRKGETKWIGVGESSTGARVVRVNSSARTVNVLDQVKVQNIRSPFETLSRAPSKSSKSSTARRSVDVNKALDDVAAQMNRNQQVLQRQQFPAINTANMGRMGSTGISKVAKTRNAGRIRMSGSRNVSTLRKRVGLDAWSRVSAAIFGIDTMLERQAGQKQKPEGINEQSRQQKTTQKSALDQTQAQLQKSMQATQQVTDSLNVTDFITDFGGIDYIVPAVVTNRISSPGTTDPTTKKGSSKIVPDLPNLNAAFNSAQNQINTRLRTIRHDMADISELF